MDNKKSSILCFKQCNYFLQILLLGLNPNKISILFTHTHKYTYVLHSLRFL